MKSIAEKLSDLKDLDVNFPGEFLNDWESEFIQGMARMLTRYGDSTTFTGKQVDKLDQIYEREFGE